MTTTELVAQLAPKFYPRPVWVAGGAVRDEILKRQPKDFDVFVGGQNLIGADVERIMEAYEEVPFSEFHKSEPFLVGQWRIEGSVVQVMSRPGVVSVDGLLDTFDWNVSLFAMDASGVVTARMEAADIAPGKTLKLQQTAYPLSSLRRGFRFAERYGMTMDHADLLSLLQRCTETLTQKKA